MKRIISVILLITVISAVCGGFSVNVGAESAERLVLAAEAEEARPGGEVKVTLLVSENPGFMFLRLTPQYDSSILTLTDVSKEGAEVVFDGLEYSKNIVIDNSVDITGTGKLVTLTFEVAPEAVTGTTHIAFTVRECYNEAENEVPFNSPETDVRIAGMQVIIGTADGVLDGTVDVTISVENNPGFCLMHLTPSYPSFMTLRSVRSSVASRCTAGANILIENDTDMTDDGVVATMTFYISEDAERDTFEIGAVILGIFNYDEDEVFASLTAGSVTIGCDHHRTELRIYSEPSCTEPGYSGDEYCSLCGELLSTGGQIPPRGHSYDEPEFFWAEDYSSARVKFSCNQCDFEETEDAAVTTERTEPTCEEDGEIRYIATATFDGVTYRDVKTVVLKATGHHYGDPVFVWRDDHSQATVSFSCTDCLDVQAFSATVIELKVEPTCTEKGSVTYTATVEFNGVTYSDTVSFEIQPKGHCYGEPAFIWADDNKTATASFTCSACQDVLTVEASVTETVKTVRKDGKAYSVTLFTATVQREGTTYSEDKEVVNFIYGDANGDGKVNGQDVIRLRKYLNGESVELNPGANANGTGSINGQDLIRLRKYLSSGDISLLGPSE